MSQTPPSDSARPTKNQAPVRRIGLPPSKVLASSASGVSTKASPANETIKAAAPSTNKAAQAPSKIVLPAAKKAISKPTHQAEEPQTPTSAEDIEIFEPEDHLRSKAMWGGALQPVHDPALRGMIWHLQTRPAAIPDRTNNPGKEEIVQVDELEDAETASSLNGDGDPGVLPRPFVTTLARPHTPALLKSIDEICVNATDHYMGCRANVTTKRVTKIHTGFDRETGTITVENDGPGIPITRNERASAKAGRDVYTPEVAMSWVFAGTNLNKAATNVKGGTNGIGAKFATACSVELNVETVSADGRKAQYYLQQFRDRLRVRRPAIIIDVSGASAEAKKIPAERRKPHTRIWFTPAYAELGYKLTNGQLHPADAEELEAWMRLRTHQIAAYVGSKCTVTFNDEPCRTHGSADLANLMCTSFGEADAAVVLTAQLKAADEPYKSHPWDVSVLVFPPGVKGGKGSGAMVGHTTIVNGVLTREGTHIKHLKKLITEAVGTKVEAATKSKKAVEDKKEKKPSVAETTACLRIVMCGALPGADWTGQRKDELQVPLATVQQYAFTAAFLKRVTTVVAERVLAAAMGKKSRAPVAIDKYIRARNSASRSHAAQCALIAAEGDSAIAFLRKGLSCAKTKQPPGSPTFDWHGVMSLQGVFLNAHRQVTELETSTGDTVVVRSARLQQNKVLQAIAAAWGLDYNRRYGTPEERAKLRYGHFIICTDQDLDGIGKIDPLTLVFVFLFWPELIRAGCVQRLNTPVVRAYPKGGKGAPAEFFYEAEFERWRAEDPKRAELHTIKYYKGLAAHDDDEVERMFAPEAFRRALYTYTLDDGARELFNVYYGPTPALRKAALSTPIPELTFEEAQALHRSRQISVSAHLERDAKAYKLDAIKRQIPHVVDGLNPARRKVIYGVIRRWANEPAAKELKIFQVGGYVADKCLYHHGDASLNSTIVHMAQAFPGARQFPYLIGVGQFGDRHGGEAGSPRYIAVKPSPLIGALLPEADMPILRYTCADGERAEPEWFVPVVPTAVLESLSIPSEGWNHISFARDLDAVLAAVGALLEGEPLLTGLAERLASEGPAPAVLAEIGAAAAEWAPPVSRRNFSGEVRMFRGVEHSFGDYKYDKATNMITVTELPIGVQTAAFLDALTKTRSSKKENPRLQYLDGDPHDSNYSGSDSIRIEIKLKPGAYEQICEAFGGEEIDPIEDFLRLRDDLRPHLNYYSETGSVLEFGQSYLAAVLWWFPARRALYLERLERARILLEFKLLEQGQILRFIPLAQTLKLAELSSEEDAAELLAAHEFVPLDTALVHQPGFTPTADLARLIRQGPRASFAFLLDLREREKLGTAVERRKERLQKTREELAAVFAQLEEKPFAGVSLWRAEIEKFKQVAGRGLATNWKFK